MRVLVVGGGPAGATAAIQALELGADVTLLEADQVGGTNLNRGPTPVRTLARAARLARDWSSWERFGLEGPRPVPNLDAVLANSARVAGYAHDKKDLAGHLRRGGIDLADHLGPARFTDPHTVRADDGRSWHGDRIVIAVGCRAAPLPVPGGDLALSYRDILALKALPHEVAVIGGADTGCQMASIFADFGAGVRLIEGGPRIVPGADASISAALSQAFEAKGMKVITGARVQALEHAGEQVIVRFTPAARPNTRRRTPYSPPSAGPPTLRTSDLTPPESLATREPSRSMTTCGPMSGTSSPPGTLMAAPSSSRAPGSKGASPPGTPSAARAARWPTRQYPAGASLIPSTARLA